MTTHDLARLRTEYRSDYAREVCEWMRGTMDSDFEHTGSRWFHVVVQNLRIPTSVRDTQQEVKFRRTVLLRACEDATAFLTGHHSNTRRKHSDAARVGCFALPAIKDGDIHLHMWVRVPACDGQVNPIRIKEQNRSTTRDVPSSLAACVDTLSRRFQTKNLWVSVTDDRSQRYAALRYCRQEWKREQRVWEEMEYLPTRLFSRVREVAA